MDPIYLFVLAIGCLLLQGCYSRDQVQDAAPVTLTETFSVDGESVLPDRWWHAFEDPNLSAVIEQGLADNFSIRTAWDRLRQAEQGAIVAGARLYPQVDFVADGSRTYESTGDAHRSFSRYAMSGGAAFEVDLWDRVDSLHKAALMDAEAAYEDVNAAAITLSAAIAQTWYQLAEAKLQEQLVASQIEANEKVLTIIRLQFRQGLVSASNVFRQEQLVESTRGQMITIQDSIVLLQHQLSVLVGRQPGLWWSDDTIGLITLPELPSTGLPSELLERRPDLRSDQKVIQAADFSVAAAIAEQYPRLSLFAESQTAAGKASDLFDDWFVDFAANITGPVFDAGLRKANVERNRAILSEAINQYGQDVLNAIREAEDALQQEFYQRKYLESLQQQLTLAERTYERTRESYLKGQLDYIRVLESLVSTQTLERNELTARRQLIEYRIELCRAMAGGWQMPMPPRAELPRQDTQHKDDSNDGTQSLL